MAFWGVEVRTGRPFIHTSQDVKGRLRISQATLGIGTSTQRSFVQCNVGNKSPVLLCALVPEKTESCHLELEFEETEDVLFSVIGPRSVYLTGYYVSSRQHHHMHSDTESYGEDIADSDGLDHCTDEDDYDDSFIDDDDEPTSFAPSPVSSQSVEIETSIEKVPKDRKLNIKRAKRRCQVIDSDDDIIVEASEDEDSVPLSSFKGKISDENIAVKECDKPKFNGEAKNANENILEDSADEDLFTSTVFKRKNSYDKKDGKQSDSPTVNSVDEVKIANNQNCKDQPDIVGAKNEKISGTDAVNCENPKKKRKERSEDIETDISMTKEVKEEHCEDKFGSVNQDPHANIKKQNLVNEMEIDSPSADMSSGKGFKLKKRKKSKKGSVEGNNPERGTVKIEREECPGNTEGPTKIDEVQTPNNHKVSEGKPDQPENGSVSENKIKKKKKKKKNSATEDNGKCTDVAGSFAEKPENFKVELIPNLVNNEADLTTVCTLSNGVVVIELSKGKLDGKVAETGKKVKIQYTAMLKENGQVIDTNVGKSPYKFRLGNEDMIQGLHFGINGMRVGEKRKLIIPPSMGYGNQGIGENVPPNSWLVYEVELVGVSR